MDPVDPVLQLLLLAWAFVDLVQAPLVLAVLVSWRLARPLGGAWKATALGFGGYTAWVIATARFVPFAPSGFVLVLVGMLLDPRREASPTRAWALGSGVAILLFWALPTGAVWLFTKRRRARGASARPGAGSAGAGR